MNDIPKRIVLWERVCDSYVSLGVLAKHFCGRYCWKTLISTKNPNSDIKPKDLTYQGTRSVVMDLFSFSFSVFTRISTLDLRRFPNNLPKDQERNSALDSWQGLESVICISWIMSLIYIEQWVPFTKQYLISCSSIAGLCEQGPLTLYVPLKLPLWI